MSLSFILCYHKVGPVAEEGRGLNIEPSRLLSHVRFFTRRRWKVVLARDLADKWPDRSVCFTFDDAYSSTMASAPSILEQCGARGCFYAVPGLVGSTSSWDGDKARPLADWETLRSARDAAHEIGNHTWDHVHLSRLGREEQVEQIRSADTRLREEGLEATSFCYPYGSVGDTSVLAESGYPVGLALGKGAARVSDDRLALPRIVIAYGDALPLLLYKMYIRPKLK
jgi:peptidoglycan/xylan/chitin deacetylase (PgdA/CDA1 family)